MSKADFSAQKGKEMFSTGLLSTLCDLMFYSPATTVKRGLFGDDQNVLPHPTAVIQKRLLHLTACIGTRNCSSSPIPPQPIPVLHCSFWSVLE